MIRVILLALLLSGCATTEIPPKVESTVEVSMKVWCGNLQNVRRIVLRFIHTLDPEWQSVCQRRSEGVTGD
jgi:PBP1b-binding outer membrane lipoprotein LpoB